MAVAQRSRRPTVSALVRDIYGSLAEDGNFDNCLHSLGERFSAHICAMHSEDLLMHRGQALLHGTLSAEELGRLNDDYGSRWAGQNLWMERGVSSLLGKGYGNGDDDVSEAELIASPYYQHFLRIADVRHGLGICLWHGEGLRLAVLTVNRSASMGPFSQEELALVGFLRPHLVVAYEVYRRLARLEDQVHSLRSGFDRLPMGMLVLDGNGRILEANVEADRLLRTGHGVARGPDASLRLCHPGDQAGYARAVARLATQPTPLPEAMFVHRAKPDGSNGNSNGLVLHLCVLPAGQTLGLATSVRIIAFLHELDRQSGQQFAGRVLQATLGLTSAEARVVLALRDEGDRALVAHRLDIAPSTLSSHLKHAFRKTGTNRVSELVHLADRLVAFAPG